MCCIFFYFPQAVKSKKNPEKHCFHIFLVQQTSLVLHNFLFYRRHAIICASPHLSSHAVVPLEASSLIGMLAYLGMSEIQTVFFVQNHMNCAVFEISY